MGTLAHGAVCSRLAFLILCFIRCPPILSRKLPIYGNGDVQEPHNARHNPIGDVGTLALICQLQSKAAINYSKSYHNAPKPQMSV